MNQVHSTNAAKQERTTIDVSLLGEFTVSVGGVPLSPGQWKLRHPRLLWQMLCLTTGRRMSRDEVIEVLWPRASAQAAANRLHHTLHVLRSIFGSVGLESSRDLIKLQGGTVWIDPSQAIDLDVTRFQAAVQAAREDEVRAPELLAQARAFYRGPLVYGGREDDWFAPRRQALSREYVWVLEQLAAQYRSEARADCRLRALQDLVHAEPSNEAAHRGLIELFFAQGKPELAVQQYAACSRYLRRDLGLEPSAATQALIQRAAGADAQSRSSRAGDVRAAAPVARFQAHGRAAALVGRESDLVDLERCLLTDGVRLLTITAAGGVGKTRVAAALAERVQAHFADGVRFISLGHVRRASRLAEQLCQAVGIEGSETAAQQQLTSYFGQRHMLLVLDRFEHLIDAAPQLVRWLVAAPRLSIVLTSQCALKSRLEYVYELAPLTLREPQAAVELFLRVAQQAGADLRAAVGSPKLLQLCERLGGNALGIELAAAQLARMPLHELPTMLDSPLSLLGLASSEPQHTSLQATIDWSISLLQDEPARLLKMLCVFAASFSADDAQAVLDGQFEPTALPHLLRTLVERHLLLRRGDGNAVHAGRLALAEAVRERVQREAAASPGWDLVRAAHARHFLSVAEQAVEQLRRGKGGQAHAIYRTAASDIERALSWQLQHTDRLACMRACWQAGALHINFGSHREAAECLQDALSIVAQGREELDQSAWCHYFAARAASVLGDVAGAVRASRRARRLAQGSSDRRLPGLIVRLLAALRCTQLRIAQAVSLIEQAIRDINRTGAADQLTGQYNVLAVCLSIQGRYGDAAKASGEALDCALAADNPQGTLWAMIVAGEIDVHLGRLDRAQATLRECHLLRKAGYSVSTDLHVALLAFYIAFERRDFDAAVGPLQEMLALCGPGLAGPPILAAIAQEFMLVESWRFSEVTVLRTLTDAQLPFSIAFAPLYVGAHAYGLFLQVLDDRWDAVLITMDRLSRVIRGTGNPAWAAWVAQSSAIAAHLLGRRALGRRFLEQSRRLLTHCGTSPTPRQIGTWGSIDLLLQQLSPNAPDTAPLHIIEALEQLHANLDCWCGAAPSAELLLSDANAGIAERNAERVAA
jgi:DNA-binding SARP family transcriptional activator/predicted ATPase